jgi:DNA-binding helix-hairpin-helix protein with protein kinase domain
MTLTIGQRVRAEGLPSELTVRQKLGEGGQGSVYLAEGPDGWHALKWYNPEQATLEQQAALRYLVQTGPPRGPAGKRFIWPEALVTAPPARQFGYLMPRIDTQRFAELGEVWARRKPAPGFAALCEISYQAANSYRALHLSGHCYRDISRGNLLFDPRTGDVLICDNDNVGVNRHSRCQVWGTLEYMAPELVRGEADPSTDTDLHALAVLLFNLWVWHHPLHGLLEYQFHSWDIPAKVHVYGKAPVFIFDPVDARNRLPNDPDYTTAQKRWSWCPPSLQALFLRAFTQGLREPARRVTEGEWQNLFLQLKDGLLLCPTCQAENLWEPSQPAPACWHCRQALARPPRLLITHAAGQQCVLLGKGAKLLRRHVKPASAEPDQATVLGEVVQHPTDPQIWGIRNLTANPWDAALPDGTPRQYAPQKAVPLRAGLKLFLEGATAEIAP